MITSTVILLLFLFIIHAVSPGYTMYKRARSVDTSQFTPQSPCPTVFQYQNDENGNLIGAIKVDRADKEGKVQLDVELSVGNSVQGYNGKITLAEDREKVIQDIMNKKPIFYKVHFPAWQNLPPRVTKILVNGNQVCAGERIPIQMVPVLTTINLQHKLSLGVTPVISPADPTVDSSTLNNIASAFNTPGNQNKPSDGQYPFDVRIDEIQTVPNNIFTDSSKPKPDTNSNPFLNVNNPYNFNPPPRRPKPDHRPPPDRPPPDNRPPPDGPPPDRHPPPDRRPPPDDQNSAFPANPFLTGWSSPGSPGQNGGSQGSEINSQSTEAPSKNGNPDYKQICGRPIATNSLIVNGQTVPRGAYPWLVAIFTQLENLSLSFTCSGSLISNRHVVTAAHCVKTEYRRVRASEIICIFGKLNIRKWITSPEERMLQPEAITVHPNYQTGKADADIAVMTFQEPIPFNNVIRPICLWQGSDDLAQVVGNIGTVVGWGKDENGDISTAEPRQVSMPIVDHIECLKGSSSSVGQALVELVSRNTFCAGFRNGSGPCNGDSGGGFLLRKSEVFYLRGIVSTALSDVTHKSCNLKEYVVFTDASKYLDWLKRILSKD